MVASRLIPLSFTKIVCVALLLEVDGQAAARPFYFAGRTYPGSTVYNSSNAPPEFYTDITSPDIDVILGPQGISVVVDVIWGNVPFSRLLDCGADNLVSELIISNVANPEALTLTYVSSTGAIQTLQESNGIELGVPHRYLFTIGPIGGYKIWRDGNMMHDAPQNVAVEMATRTKCWVARALRPDRPLFQGTILNLFIFSGEMDWDTMVTQCQAVTTTTTTRSTRTSSSSTTGTTSSSSTWSTTSTSSSSSSSSTSSSSTKSSTSTSTSSSSTSTSTTSSTTSSSFTESTSSSTSTSSSNTTSSTSTSTTSSTTSSTSTSSISTTSSTTTSTSSGTGTSTSSTSSVSTTTYTTDTSTSTTGSTSSTSTSDSTTTTSSTGTATTTAMSSSTSSSTTDAALSLLGAVSAPLDTTGLLQRTATAACADVSDPIQSVVCQAWSTGQGSRVVQAGSEALVAILSLDLSSSQNASVMLQVPVVGVQIALPPEIVNAYGQLTVAIASPQAGSNLTAGFVGPQVSPGAIVETTLHGSPVDISLYKQDGSRLVIEGLKQPILMQLSSASPGNESKCAYWDESKLSWSSNGVWPATVAEFGPGVADGTWCATTHLSFFSLITQVVLECSNLQVLSAENLQSIRDPANRWWKSTASVLLAVVVLLLLLAVVQGARTDVAAVQSQLWKDDFFVTGVPVEQKTTPCLPVIITFARYCWHLLQKRPEVRRDEIRLRVLTLPLQHALAYHSGVHSGTIAQHAWGERGWVRGSPAVTHSAELSRKVDQLKDMLPCVFKSYARCGAGAFLGRTWVLFWSVNPLTSLGQVLIEMHALKRALILSVRLLGSLALTAIFFTVNGDAMAATAPSKCPLEPWSPWRYLLVMAISGVVNMLPLSLLNWMASRWFHHLPDATAEDARKYARIRFIEDLVFAVWGCGLTALNLLILVGFLAELKTEEQAKWLLTFGLVVGRILVAQPLLVSLLIATAAELVAWRAPELISSPPRQIEVDLDLLAAEIAEASAEVLPPWEETVRQLAYRGISTRHLLGLYGILGTHVMPGFDPAISTTADVVRQVLIPLTVGQMTDVFQLTVVIQHGKALQAGQQLAVVCGVEEKQVEVQTDFVEDKMGRHTWSFDALLPDYVPGDSLYFQVIKKSSDGRRVQLGRATLIGPIVVKGFSGALPVHRAQQAKATRKQQIRKSRSASEEDPEAGKPFRGVVVAAQPRRLSLPQVPAKPRPTSTTQVRSPVEHQLGQLCVQVSLNVVPYIPPSPRSSQASPSSPSLPSSPESLTQGPATPAPVGSVVEEMPLPDLHTGYSWLLASQSNALAGPGEQRSPGSPSDARRQSRGGVQSEHTGCSWLLGSQGGPQSSQPPPLPNVPEMSEESPDGVDHLPPEPKNNPPDRSRSARSSRGEVSAIMNLSENLYGVAYSTLASNGRGQLAQKMVTHNWDNRFAHMLAAVFADALNMQTFDQVAELLANQCLEQLYQRLAAVNRLDFKYWICACSVNQHSGICGRGGTDTSGKRILPCPCNTPKHFAGDFCEMNKFDDMMSYLKVAVKRQARREGTTASFGQVVAMDLNFNLLSRVWCIAELAQAHESLLPQELKMHSCAAWAQGLERLKSLDVRNAEASVLSDKELVLAKINDHDLFNEQLKELVFRKLGLWQSLEKALEVEVAAGMLEAAVAFG